MSENLESLEHDTLTPIPVTRKEQVEQRRLTPEEIEAKKAERKAAIFREARTRLREELGMAAGDEWLSVDNPLIWNGNDDDDD